MLAILSKVWVWVLQYEVHIETQLDMDFSMNYIP